MKGLLIKDLRLLKAQKTFLMTVGGFAIIFIGVVTFAFSAVGIKIGSIFAQLRF